MRLQSTPLNFVVNLLLGVSWGGVIVGIVSPFLAFYHESLGFALVSSFMGAIPGLIGVVLVEHFIIAKERHLELQKQTYLLEKLLTTKEEESSASE